MIYDYDSEVDILTIRLRGHVQAGEIVDSEEFPGGLVAEYADDGNLVQIELRDARRKIAGEAHEERHSLAA
jgi:uncharacterized protein YuzE